LAAAVGLGVACRQLINLNKSLRIASLTAILELEAEILENPGAIEPWLVRRRRPD